MLSRQIAAAYLRMLDFPHLVLAALAVLVAVAALYTTRFSFDASSDTLVVEGDPDLATYLAVTETFGSDQFLLMTFSPHAGDALDVSNLAVIDQLSQRLSTITGVANVFSILDAPLLKSPPVALADMAEAKG